MIDPAGGLDDEPRFSFMKGASDEFGQITNHDFDWEEAASKTRLAITDALSARNVSFLFGAGASSYQANPTHEQLGIPVMGPLAKEFTACIGSDDAVFPSSNERQRLLTSFKIDITTEPFSKNLERLMEVLYAFQNAFSVVAEAERPDVYDDILSVIGKVQRFVVSRCTTGPFESDDTVLKLYEAFYRRLIFRDRALPQPWVFTTNYDLFSEHALDRLGLPYANGFSGTVDRRFNPATFRYALAEQLDLSNRKWSAVDGFVYLCKLHGSVSWYSGGQGLFPIKESFSSTPDERVMIYPTPAKQSASFATPYVDLFREFQGRIVRDQSVLVTIGFGFGDEHIVNIIYQALTIPTFRLIVFASPEWDPAAKRLIELNDPRIWVIGGEGQPGAQNAHYFETIIESFMPEEPGRRIDDAIANVVNLAANGTADGTAKSENSQARK